MRNKLFFICLFILSFFSAQRNREEEALERQEKRDRYFIEQNNKYGVKDTLGNVLIKPIFDDIDFFEREDLFIVEKDSLYGIISKYGKIIIPIQYKSVKNFEQCFWEESDFQKENFKKHLNNFIFAYTNDDYYNHQFGIFTKDGELIYPTIIYRFKSVREYKGNLYFIVEENGEVNTKVSYEGNDIRVEQRRLVKLQNNKFIQESIKVDYTDLNFIYTEKKNILVYYVGNKCGFYDMETQKKSGRKYIDFIRLNNKIYAKKKKFYNYILDENFNEKKSKDSIVGGRGIYTFIQEGENMRIMKNGIKSKFSYPTLEFPSTYSPGFGYYFPDKNYEDYLKTIFKFYPKKIETLKSNLYGIIDFKGKIFLEPIYENVEIYPIKKYFRSSYDEDKIGYYKKNHLDYFIVAKSYHNDGYKIVNSVGDELVYLNKDYYAKYINRQLFNDSSNSGITKEFYYRSSDYNSGFFVYNIKNKRVVLESDKGRFSLRKNGGFIHQYYENKEQTLIYYSENLNKLYEKKSKYNEKDYDDLARNIIRGKEMYFFEGNKIGLIDFNEKELLPAKFDEIKINNFYKNYYVPDEKEFTSTFSVTKKGKSALLNKDYKIVIPFDYDEIKYLDNPYFEIYMVKKNNKYGLITRDNLLLVPINYNYEIYYDKNWKSFNLKDRGEHVFVKDYSEEKSNIWYNFSNQKFMIIDGVIFPKN